MCSNRERAIDHGGPSHLLQLPHTTCPLLPRWNGDANAVGHSRPRPGGVHTKTVHFYHKMRETHVSQSLWCSVLCRERVPQLLSAVFFSDLTVVVHALKVFGTSLSHVDITCFLPHPARRPKFSLCCAELSTFHNSERKNAHTHKMHQSSCSNTAH